MNRMSGRTLVFGLLVILPFLRVEPASAITAEVSAVMVQCRNLSFDQSGFDECLAVLERESELALLGIESDWITLEEQTAGSLQGDPEPSDVDQLRVMATQYREYRDQLCNFSSKGLDFESKGPALQACRISMNRERISFLQQHFIERRSRMEHGSFYRGYFLMTEDSGLFQSCDLRQDWVIDVGEEALEQIGERYSEVTSESLELVYIELRGQLSVDKGAEPMMQIQRLNLLRPILDTDCTSAISINNETESANEENDPDTNDEEGDDATLSSVPGDLQPVDRATIDDFGAAGFMYGYFGEWTSFCAADAQQVCQAQTRHSLSTEGDWLLLIDRSTDLAWRVRLQPVTSSHVVGGALQLSVDGVALTTIPVASQQIILDRPQTLMQADAALQLINRLKTAGTLEITWNSVNQNSASVIFSLNGVTLALDYFDTRGN